MKSSAKNWIWFLALIGLIVGGGLFVGRNRRADLGKSFTYSLDEYRQVDPLLIQYAEVEPVVPAIGNPTALALARGFVCVGGSNGIEVIGDKTIPVVGTVTCLAFDDEGTLFAGVQDHIIKIPKDGEIQIWPSPSEKAYLTSIDVDDWYVYVADAGSRRIWRYKKEGGAPFEIGKKDWANGVRGFYIPSPYFDLAISPADGSVWAVNSGHHAVENYRPDGMPLSSWEATGMHIEGFSGCCNPSHFALLPDGGFVTAEKGLPRVKIHNVDGSLRCVVAAPDQFEDDVTGLDVAVGPNGKIYVLDPARNRVRVFEEKK
ncbi:hypothetical protein P4B35_00715 [Pontiellaceae bacterium B12227]|nr:hypothetical protein [Pontiellaceae bacterium B12227]